MDTGSVGYHKLVEYQNLDEFTTVVDSFTLPGDKEFAALYIDFLSNKNVFALFTAGVA